MHRISSTLFSALWIAAVSSGCNAPSPSEPTDPLHGRWRVTSFVSAPISAMSDEESAAYLGETMVLSATAATFAGRRFANPDYARGETSADEFFRQSRMHLADLGIRGDRLHFAHLSDDPGPGASLILDGNDRILTCWDGVFLVLEREG